MPEYERDCGEDFINFFNFIWNKFDIWFSEHMNINCQKRVGPDQGNPVESKIGIRLIEPSNWASRKTTSFVS